MSKTSSPRAGSPTALEDKANVKHVDTAHNKADVDSGDDYGFTPEEQRKIIHRIDRRLVTMVGALYCVSLMDRTNMSAANIAGMGVELNLIDYRYVR